MKSGFIALIGRSNVGKSTLLNTLVGTKISATSFRPQMTRHAIHGVLNMIDGPGSLLGGQARLPCSGIGGQAVFIDTPGILKGAKNALTAKLINKVKETVAEKNIDLILYVVDPSKSIGPEELYTYGLIRHLDIPKILVINKTDLPARERMYQTDYENWSNDFDSVFLVSALRASHIQPLKQKVMELLPDGELLYPPEQWTNIDHYFWIAEIIREKAYSVLDKEIPYSVTVEVDSIEEKPSMIVIEARLLTNAEKYKKMIIGRGASKIKEIGQMARRELEAALGKKIYLQLEVYVDKHWVERV